MSHHHFPLLKPGRHLDLLCFVVDCTVGILREVGVALNNASIPDYMR
jgi:hypothetical protein